MGHKKNKLQKQKKEKQLWGDDDSTVQPPSSSSSSSEKNYFKLLHDDCREMEHTILDHEPKQYCQKKKKQQKVDEEENISNKTKKKKSREKQVQDESLDSTSVDAESSLSQKSKKKTMSNLDYINILEETLTEEEKNEFFNVTHTTRQLISSTQDLQKSMSEYSTYLNNMLLNNNSSNNSSSFVMSSDATAELLTLELSKHYEFFKCNSFNRNESLAAIVVLVSKISKRIFSRDERNAFYVCKVLNLLCNMMTRLAPALNDCEEYSQIVDELAFILYKFAEHAKARYVMLATGVFYSLWMVAQSSKNDATIVHVNEVMELLGGALSMGFDLGNLLVHSNKYSRDVEYLKSTLSAYGEAESTADTSGSFPDTFIGFSNNESEIYVTENDFNVSVHYAIVSSRSNFLSKNCLKWNPTTNVLSTHETGPGYYLLVDPDISWYALLKFLQIIYSDKLSASLEETKKLRTTAENPNNFSVEQKLISEGKIYFEITRYHTHNEMTNHN